MSRQTVYFISIVLTYGLFLTSPTSAIDLNDPDLVGYWPFNEGTGKTTADLSANGYNGTLNGGVEWRKGVSKSALQFNGNDAYVGTGQSILNGLTEFTLAGWVSASNVDVYSSLFGQNEVIEFGFIGGSDVGTWTFCNNWVLVSADYPFDYPSWHHVALTGDAQGVTIYIDGQEAASGSGVVTSGTSGYTFNIGANVFNASGDPFLGEIDEVFVFSRALNQEEIQLALQGTSPELASNPVPADEAVDVCRDVVLSWSSGEYADTHDVYFGTVFDDVNDAGRDNDPHGLLVSPGQHGNSYDPPGLLEFDQTYYWRIDEVNTPSDPYTYKGKVWSFTVEPLGYPILGENITATASSFNIDDTEQGPGQTVNGSGLEGDLHSRNVEDMWLTASGDEGPAWIKFEFDKVYKLHEMLVWNYNGPSSLRFLGIKDVAVRYSIDDVNWVTIPDINEFNQATGSSNYAANTTVPFNGVSAKYVEIDANSNFSGGIFDQYGLSEVRFLYIPARARKPVPTSGEADVALDAVLSWRAGREAETHDIYFGTSRQEVAEATVATESFSGESCEIVYVPSSLALGQRYYWKVVETDPDSEVWESDIWNFSTIQNFVVDDFESYTDFSPDEVFNTWIDGYDDTSNGSTAGYPDPDFLLLDEHYMETVIVHGGDQSMPFFYDNSGSIAYSEATRTFNTPQDWTVKDVQMLTLFFRGDPPAFVEIEPGNILMSGIGADIYGTTDEFNYAYKKLTGDGSITVRIDSVQNTDEWAKAGVMIRSSLEEVAQQVDMIGTPSNRVEWMYRASTGGTTAGNETGVDSITFPHWVRIRRQGNTFIGEHSTDGVNWTTTTPGDLSSSSATVQMPNTVYIGLVVTSHVSGETCQAEFSEVSTTGNVTGQWQTADIGVEQNVGNAADRLYVVVEDNSGNSETYEHPENPNAVLIGDWRQWNIPLNALGDAGVNLTSIRRMTIGVGDKTAPMHGSGLLFIDDIWLYTPLPDSEL
jgi:hypothetical protein